jgi:hypothetical protein
MYYYIYMEDSYILWSENYARRIQNENYKCLPFTEIIERSPFSGTSSGRRE